MNRKKHYMHLLLGTTIVLVIAFAPRAAHADGGVFPYGRDADVSMPDQKAIIVYDEERGREDLILSVGLMGGSTEAAWVVPVPSLPEVNTASAEWFERLSELTQPEILTRTRLTTFPGGPTAEFGQGRVEVLSREQVGVYDVAVLSASESTALLDWLDDQGFEFPSRGERILDAYVAEGWIFVATRVAPGETAELEGDVHPLCLSFETAKPVYPMRLTSLMADYMDVLIYLLSDHRMEVEDPELDFETEFAGMLTLDPVASEEDELNDLLTSRSYYVTKLRSSVSRSDMAHDLYFVHASNDEPYRRIVYRYHYLTLDECCWCLVGFSLLVLAPLAVVVWVRRREEDNQDSESQP
jgi:hypothetical protein